MAHAGDDVACRYCLTCLLRLRHSGGESKNSADTPACMTGSRLEYNASVQTPSMQVALCVHVTLMPVLM